MRALKAILTAAGALRRKISDQS